MHRLTHGQRSPGLTSFALTPFALCLKFVSPLQQPFIRLFPISILKLLFKKYHTIVWS